MRSEGAFRFGRILVAASAIGALAGCAAQPAAPREAGIRVTAIERSRWDLPPEAGLFRVFFDANLARELRRSTDLMVSQEDIAPYYAEIRVLEGEADRELKARKLCGGTAALLGPPDDGGGQGAISAIFKCRPTLF